MLGALRGRFGIFGIVALVVILVTLLVFFGYRFYMSNIANTPERAVRTYLDTLNQGDMVKLYDMTRGASGQTQAEFANSMAFLTKDKRITIDTAASPALYIGREGVVSYYRVMARLRTADGSYRLLPILVEAVREGDVWRVGLYVPPLAIPTGQ